MASSSGRPRGTLVFDIGEGFSLFVGSGLVTTLHRHFTGSLTVALDQPMQVREVGQAARPAGIMLVAPNASHALDAADALVLNLQVDPERDHYATLASQLSGPGAIRLFSWEESAPLRDVLRARLEARTLTPRSAWEALTTFLRTPTPEARTRDPRVDQTLAALKRALPDFPRVGELAAEVGLSENRLIRLFSAEVGVPLRRYMLWLRLRFVLFCAAQTRNLTTAAHRAGFADSAHFTRVFRDMFGVAPTSLLKSSEVSIEVVFPHGGVLRGPHADTDAEKVSELAEVLRTRERTEGDHSPPDV